MARNASARSSRLQLRPSSSVERPVQWPRTVPTWISEPESPPCPPCGFPCDDESRPSVCEWERLDRSASGGRGRLKLDSPSHVGRCPSARVLVRTLSDDSRRASSFKASRSAENGFSLLSITSSSFLHQHEPRPLLVPPTRSSPPPNLDHTPTVACFLYPNAATCSAHSSLFSPAQLPQQRIVAVYAHPSRERPTSYALDTPICARLSSLLTCLFPSLVRTSRYAPQASRMSVPSPSRTT
ncbi:hypothetical protein C8Q76DRAFT_242551 [Earliella scabrosa]|nr:hypothetical protein C8Q76DRAFT_242551 [Earliella scabrosa]